MSWNAQHQMEKKQHIILEIMPPKHSSLFSCLSSMTQSSVMLYLVADVVFDGAMVGSATVGESASKLSAITWPGPTDGIVVVLHWYLHSMWMWFPLFGYNYYTVWRYTVLAQTLDKKAVARTIVMVKIMPKSTSNLYQYVLFASGSTNRFCVDEDTILSPWSNTTSPEPDLSSISFNSILEEYHVGLSSQTGSSSWFIMAVSKNMGHVPYWNCCGNNCPSVALPST